MKFAGKQPQNAEQRLGSHSQGAIFEIREARLDTEASDESLEDQSAVFGTFQD